MIRLFLLTILFSLQPDLVAASNNSQCVTVEGEALVDETGQAYARQMAIRDALQNATMQNNLQIVSSHTTKNFQIKDQAGRFVSKSKVQKYQVADEYFDKDRNVYQVELDVCLTSDMSACTSALGGEYQNRLVVAPVVIENPYEARDISNLLLGYQQEIYRRLLDRGYRNLEIIDYAQSVQPGQMVAPNLSADVLQPIQDQTGAQFMLMTVIRSASAHQEGGKLKNLSDKVRRHYDFEVHDNLRYLEVDWYLIDLNKQKIAKQQRESYQVEKKVRVGRDKAFGTASFFETSTGQAFNLILDQQVSGVFDHMACEILETQIIDVRNGEYVLFLSEDSGVRAGDELAVYHQIGTPVRFQGRSLGIDELPAGFIRIKRIMPKFAIAELVVEKEKIELGDIVRSW